jgi:2-polyprenyl-3-methyl-5-hydroxy-6-metoxy-1,4-benzoquinol methylase
MIKLDIRATDPEIMDDFTLPDSEVVPVLKGLEKMNTIFGGHKMLINALESLDIKKYHYISDWGCGGGDALRAISKWGVKKNVPLKLTGIDATSSVVEFARKQALSYPNITFMKADVIKTNILRPEQFDVVVSSLFMHHFTDDEWVELVKKMADCSKKAVIITDLHRHWLLYYSVLFIAYTFTTSKMARSDGPLSVRRAFKKRDLVNLLQQSGLTNYKIEWKWPFRWQVIIYKS